MVLEVVPSTLLMYCVPAVRPACSSVSVTQYCLVAVHTQEDAGVVCEGMTRDLL